MEVEQRTIDVKDLELDHDNPRFCHLVLSGRTLNTQEELLDEILKDTEIITLMKSIKRSGVQDPIWIRQREDGKYLVLEGNRRTVVLKILMRDNIIPPEGVTYSKVLANIIPSNTSKTDELLQKARLQAGKKEWGAFNEAAVTYILRNEYLLEIEDIATELQISQKEVNKRLENYDLFREYVDYSKDENPRKFSFFNDAPPKVRNWIPDNKKTYFDLINPRTGIQKIPSVSTKGGLRDFATVLQVPEALDYLINNENVTVEDALEIAKDIDIKKDLPFINRLGPLAIELFKLDDTQIEKIKMEPKIIQSIKQLRNACNDILEKIDNK